jgi:hypothetical protein
MGQMVLNLFFRDADSLGDIAMGYFAGTQQINDLLPYGLFIVNRLHVSLSLLYFKPYNTPSPPKTLKHLHPGVNQRFSMDMISIFRLPI